MEYSALQTFMTVLLAICGGVVGIAGAVAVVVRFWKWAHRDTDKNTATLKEFETYLASDKRRIEALERNQEEADEQNTLMLRALISIIEHEVDGNNHTEKLMESRDAIQDYLFERKRKSR